MLAKAAPGAIVKATFRIRAGVYRRLKAAAIKSRVSMQDLMNSTLDAHLPTTVVFGPEDDER